MGIPMTSYLQHSLLCIFVVSLDKISLDQENANNTYIYFRADQTFTNNINYVFI